MMGRVLCVLLLVACSSARSQSFSGRVVGIADGDTIDVLRDNRAVRVRLHGIDRPERRQPFGRQARQFTGTVAVARPWTCACATRIDTAGL